MERRDLREGELTRQWYYQRNGVDETPEQIEPSQNVEVQESVQVEKPILISTKADPKPGTYSKVPY
ncbi:MAG: hypothetical protein Q7R49_05170 [Candidatus Daviesbacteria bacterium]|nr:hypothetical protein [Candidatus Daviesbacteria bacterium]